MNAVARLVLGFLVAGLLVTGGCRSSADRMRVLEAKKAESEKQNEDLKKANADGRAELLRSETEREALQAQLHAAQDALMSRPAVHLDNEALREMPGVSVKDGGSTIVLASDVTFRPGRADLNKDATRTLGQVAASLKSVEQIGKIRVEGHTDADPIKKSGWKDNRELSLARANQVRRYLVSQGISESLVAVEGFGESKPIASNKTEAGKAQNRRVEIILHPAE
jgi:flagellar motor protein MotB